MPDLRTAQLASIAAHPVRRMTGEYVAVAMGPAAAGPAPLAEHAVDASFFGEQRKGRLRSEIAKMTLPDPGSFA